MMNPNIFDDEPRSFDSSAWSLPPTPAPCSEAGDRYLGDVPCVWIPAGTYADLPIRISPTGERIAVGNYLLNPQAALELIKLLVDGINAWRQSILEEAP